MKQKLTWKQKYELSLDENISVKSIEKLLDCGQPSAIEIRNMVIDYCNNNNIVFFGNGVPTDVVLKVINKDRNYFYSRMLDEMKLQIDA